MRLRPTTLETTDCLRAEVQLWAVSQGVSVWLIDAEPLEPCRVAGLVRRWRIDPACGRIEITIWDGTGFLRATWPIASRLPVTTPAPGSGLVLEGVPVLDASGVLMMFEPRFDEAPFPAVT